MFVASVWRRWDYRRRGERMPWFFTGSIAGTLGLVCLVASFFTPDSWLDWTLISAGVLVTFEIVVFTRARRRAVGAPAS